MESIDSGFLEEFLREARGDVGEASKLADMTEPEFRQRLSESDIELEYRGRVGNCFKSSAQLMMQFYSQGIETELVHGFQVLNVPPFSEYSHSWIEINCFCIDSEAQVGMPLPEYYEQGHIDQERCVRYSVEDILNEINASGHWGPWQESFLEKTI